MHALRNLACGSAIAMFALIPYCAHAQGQQGQHRQHAAQWLKQHKDEPLAQAERDLERDPNFRRLSPQGQEQLRRRLQHFNSLPPQQKDQMVHRLQRFERLSPEQQQRARVLFERFRALPPDRRLDLISAFRALHNVPPNQLDSVLNQPDFRRQYNENEREILRGMSQLNIGPANQR